MSIFPAEWRELGILGDFLTLLVWCDMATILVVQHPNVCNNSGQRVLPRFAIVSIFMMVESYLQETNNEAYIKPALDNRTDRRRSVFWVMVVVFRDVFICFTGATVFVAIQLDK